MKIRTKLFGSLVSLVLLLASCSLPAPTGTPSVPTPRITTITAPVPTEPTASAPGPAIAHIPDGQGISIMDIHMLDLINGWGIGGLHQASDHVFRTRDGGVTWQDVTPPQPELSAGDQAGAIGCFPDANTAWVIYGSTLATPPAAYLWITHDGGATWQYSLIDTSISNEFFAPQFIDFVNPNRGWMLVALGAGMSHSYVTLLSTIDGGLTWTTLVTPQDNNDIQACPKTSMIFTDVLNGWLARECTGLYPLPYILHTSDGGATWTGIQPLAPASFPTLYADYACDMLSPIPFSVSSIVMVMKCLSMADFKSELDYFYSTKDGGLTWSSSPMPLDFSLGAGLYFFDPQNGFAFGRNIYKTTDGGQTWSFVQAVTWDGQFSFVTANKGWASVMNDNQENALVITVDGGVKWNLLNPMVVP